MDNLENEAFTPAMLELKAVMNPCDWEDYKYHIVAMQKDWIEPLFNMIVAGIDVDVAFKLFLPIRRAMGKGVSINDATDFFIRAAIAGINTQRHINSTVPLFECTEKYTNFTGVTRQEATKAIETLESLEGKLAIAVGNENYERAQWLKDKIDEKLQNK